MRQLSEYQLNTIREHGIHVVNNICKWITTNNRMPSNRSLDIYERNISYAIKIKRNAKAGSGNRLKWLDVYQEIADSYNLFHIFDSIPKNNQIPSKIHALCKYIIQYNKYPSNNLEDKNELSLYRFWRRICLIKTGLSRYMFNDTWNVILDSYNLPHIFNHIEDSKYQTLYDLCEWITKNGRMPIIRDDAYYYNKVNAYKYTTFNEEQQRIIESYNLTHLLNNEDNIRTIKARERVHVICKYLINKPILNLNDKLDAKYYNAISRLKTIKHNKHHHKSHLWDEEFQVIADSYGLHTLFDKVDLELTGIKNLTMLCEFIKTNNRLPIRNNLEEVYLYNTLHRMKSVKKDNRNWYNSYDKILNSYGYADLLNISSK